MKGDQRHFTGKLPAFTLAIFWSPFILQESTTGKRIWWSKQTWKQVSIDTKVFLPKLWILFFRTPRFYKETPGDVYVVPHLQKKSRWGVFFTWPFGLSIWAWVKMQKNEEPWGGPYTPNSEWGLYVRFPGYRWDKDLGMITTGGRAPGTHWD